MTMESSNENVIEWLRGEDTAALTLASNGRLCNKLKRMHEDGNINIPFFVQNKDGSICCRVPLAWVKVSPPRHVSDEQKKAFTDRMAALRETPNVSPQGVEML